MADPGQQGDQQMDGALLPQESSEAEGSDEVSGVAEAANFAESASISHALPAPLQGVPRTVLSCLHVRIGHHAKLCMALLRIPSQFWLWPGVPERYPGLTCAKASRKPQGTQR